MSGEKKKKVKVPLSDEDRKTQLKTFQDFCNGKNFGGRSLDKLLKYSGEVKHEAQSLGFNFMTYNPWYVRLGDQIKQLRSGRLTIIGDKLTFEDILPLWEKLAAAPVRECEENFYTPFGTSMLERAKGAPSSKNPFAVDYPSGELKNLNNLIVNLRNHARKHALEVPTIKYSAAAYTAVGFLLNKHYVGVMNNLLEQLMKPLGDPSMLEKTLFSFDPFKRMNEHDCVICSSRIVVGFGTTRVSLRRHMIRNHNFEPVQCTDPNCSGFKRLFPPSEFQKHRKSSHKKTGSTERPKKSKRNTQSSDESEEEGEVEISDCESVDVISKKSKDLSKDDHPDFDGGNGKRKETRMTLRSMDHPPSTMQDEAETLPNNTDDTSITPGMIETSQDATLMENENSDPMSSQAGGEMDAFPNESLANVEHHVRSMDHPPSTMQDEAETLPTLLNTDDTSIKPGMIEISQDANLKENENSDPMSSQAGGEMDVFPTDGVSDDENFSFHLGLVNNELPTTPHTRPSEKNPTDAFEEESNVESQSEAVHDELAGRKRLGTSKVTVPAAGNPSHKITIENENMKRTCKKKREEIIPASMNSGLPSLKMFVESANGEYEVKQGVVLEQKFLQTLLVNYVKLEERVTALDSKTLELVQKNSEQEKRILDLEVQLDVYRKTCQVLDVVIQDENNITQ